MRKGQPGNAKTAIAYVRVSTDDQRNGPAAQRAEIELWASRELVTVAETFEDHVSGARPLEGRAGLMAALEALRPRNAGVLVVAKRDRIARDVVIALTVERLAKDRGAELVSADGVARGDDPASQFMRTVVDGAAAYERGLIRARTKAALGAKAARGEFVGCAPYGFRTAADGIHLELAPREQAMLRRVRALRATGLSHCSIGRQMAREGYLNRVGKRLGITEISRILARQPAAPACGRGHPYEDHDVGKFCCRGSCKEGRGDRDPRRQIAWRQP